MVVSRAFQGAAGGFSGDNGSFSGLQKVSRAFQGCFSDFAEDLRGVPRGSRGRSKVFIVFKGVLGVSGASKGFMGVSKVSVAIQGLSRGLRSVLMDSIEVSMDFRSNLGDFRDLSAFPCASRAF